MNKIVNSPEQKAGYSKKGPSLIFLIQIYLEEPLYEKCQIKKKTYRHDAWRFVR